MEKVFHTIDPIYDKNSKILILGSFPSVKSRKENFYYAHPQNQFWNILSDVFNEKIVDKREFLIRHNIALWDVVKSCTIDKSKDSSIKNVVVNDILSIVDATNIKHIFTVGKKAYQLYNKYLKDKVLIDAIYLPSTSPIYAFLSYHDKLNEYLIIKEILDKN